MSSASHPGAVPPEPGAPASRGYVRRVFSGTPALMPVVYRDPEHLAERLTLYAGDRIADESTCWVESARPATRCRETSSISIWAASSSGKPPTPVLKATSASDRAPSAHVRARSPPKSPKSYGFAPLARIDGAISGTPFFIALVPGYVSYLWQEMRMTMRTAGLYDRDLRALGTAAEMLALRGVQPNVKSAEDALISVKDMPVPRAPHERCAPGCTASTCCSSSAGSSPRPPPRRRSAAVLTGCGRWPACWSGWRSGS